MTYQICIYKDNVPDMIFGDIPTRADLAHMIDELTARFPRSEGWQFAVHCHVTRIFTLLDEDVTTGDATEQKLTDFVNREVK